MSKMNRTTVSRVVIALAVVGGLWSASAAFADTTTADWTTTAKVKLELLNKLGTDALRMNVDTVQGKVQLSGTVDKRASVELADDIAKSVSGVTGVDNDLRLEPRTDATAAVMKEAENEVKDAVLEAKLRIALIDKLGADGFKVGTEAASGVVTLEFDSSLPSSERQNAERTARAVDGVKRVITVEKKG
jgi:osmotically-inducible protein OsmY